MESTIERGKPRGGYWIRVGLWLSLPFLCCGAYYLGNLNRGDSAATNVRQSPPLQIDASALDFGEVLETSQFHWKLTLSNVSQEDVDIARFETSCDCASIEPKQLRIAAGHRDSVEVTLNLTQRSANGPTPNVWNHSPKIIAVVAGQEESRYLWQLNGKIRNSLEMSANTVYFGDRPIRGLPSERRVVTLKPLVPITGIVARPSSPNVVADLRRMNGGYELAIEPTTAHSGPLNEEVTLHLTAENGQVIPDRKIAVLGVVSEPVVALPAVVEFGIQKQGEVAEETLLFQSRTGRPFKVCAIDCNSTDVAFTSVASPSETGYAVVVRKTFGGAGQQSQWMYFLIDYDEGEWIQIPVEIRWFTPS